MKRSGITVTAGMIILSVELIFTAGAGIGTDPFAAYAAGREEAYLSAGEIVPPSSGDGEKSTAGITAANSAANTTKTSAAPSAASPAESATAPSAADSDKTTVDPSKNGWFTVKAKGEKQKLYYQKGIPVTGVAKISGKYYLFREGSGWLVTKTCTIHKVKYYIEDNGCLHMMQKGSSFQKPNGDSMSKADASDYLTLLRAKQIVGHLTKPSWSKSQKRLVCFKWVSRHSYIMHRKFCFQKDWPSLYARDVFDRKGGDCRSDAAAFAYLAAAIGYQKVYVCTDTAPARLRHVKSDNIHAWAEIDGRIYDTLFARIKSFSRFYGGKYTSRTCSARFRVPVPYAGHNTGFENSSHRDKPKKDKTRKLTIKRWDAKKKHLYYSDGSVVTGDAWYKGKFYSFTKQGGYQKARTGQLRAAAKRGKDITELGKLLSKPQKKTYQSGCYGDGMDGIWTYPHFLVFTYRDTDGSEIYMGAEYRKS